MSSATNVLLDEKKNINLIVNHIKKLSLWRHPTSLFFWNLSWNGKVKTPLMDFESLLSRKDEVKKKFPEPKEGKWIILL